MFSIGKIQATSAWSYKISVKENKLNMICYIKELEMD